MDKVPDYIYRALETYIPKQNGFGFSFESNWNREKSIDAIIKIFDYVAPQIGAVAKALSAVLLLMADFVVPDATPTKGRHLFQLDVKQRAYLRAQVIRGLAAVVVGRLGLVVADAVATAYLSENAALLQKCKQSVSALIKNAVHSSD